MEDDLTIINKIIDEHKTIRENLKVAGDTVNDLEALQSLEQARRDSTVDQSRVPIEKLTQLRRLIGILEEGLGNHFNYEERVLPPLLGEVLMRALVIVHQKIRNEIGEAKSVIDNSIEGLSQEESVAQITSRINPRIDTLYKMVMQHGGMEEAILKMAQLALREEE